MDFSFLTKISFVRLALVVVVAMAALQAYLYAQGGFYDRIDDSIAGGLFLAFAMALINAANKEDSGFLGYLGLIMGFVGFSLLFGRGMWPWDWPMSWLANRLG